MNLSKGDMQQYYEIRATNTDKDIGINNFVIGLCAGD